MNGTTTKFAMPDSLRKCVLCGKAYKDCKCTCHCGVKKWIWDPNIKLWFHHVCGGQTCKH